jgi:hypothetical protein
MENTRKTDSASLSYMIRGNALKIEAELDKVFAARIGYNFGINIEHWPIITRYHSLMSEIIHNNDLVNEAHVWWVLIYTRDDPRKVNEFKESGAWRRVGTLGKIIREAILDKYPSIRSYGGNPDTAIQKVYAVRVIGGLALPRHKTLTAIAHDCGYQNIFELVKAVLDREVKRSA